MTDFIAKHSDVWGDNPAVLLEEYDYHPELTAELDELGSDELDRETLFKIVLWKLSRFPYISDSLLKEISCVSNLGAGDHRESEIIIKKLLKTRGIALPMASTILRFMNPTVFQIIDDRAYRVALPGAPKYPSKPQNITEGYLNRSIEIYFAYLDRIVEISSDRLPFEHADRILYQLDISLGHRIGD